MNNRGQFSIIAAMFIAVILISSVMMTYSAIRYGSTPEEPQILSAIDETNLGLKQVLGFTVGYYGSVLQVTGNSSYARALASKYLDSGLANLADVKPEWGASFEILDLVLSDNWYTNSSYSTGTLTVNYSLSGLGVSGVTYSASCRLEVNIFQSPSGNQVCLNVTKDGDEPLNDLGKQDFKFYRYLYPNMTWVTVNPTTPPVAYADGTYLITIPADMPEISPYAYSIQVEDTRGLMVVASSFSHYTSSLLFNSTYVNDNVYVDNSTSNVDPPPNEGTHSDFEAQKQGPDGINDTLTEEKVDTLMQNYYPNNWIPLGSTTNASGLLADLQTDNKVNMTFQSYPFAFSGLSSFGYATKGLSTTDLTSVRGSRFLSSSGGLASNMSACLKFTATSSTFGNSATGYSGNTILDTIKGQRFTSPSSPVVAQSIAAYIYCSLSAKNMKAAIYDSTGNLVAVTDQKSVSSGSSAAWQTFTFASPPTLNASTNYALVVWSQTGSGSADLRYSSSSGGNGRSLGQTYGNWPSPASFSTNNYQYSIYCNYLTTFKAKAAIYTSTGNLLIASTDERTLTTLDGWVTFNFTSPPIIAASTSYVLVIFSSNTSVTIYRDTGSAERFEATGTYPTWPTSVADQSSQRTYSIYCSYTIASEFKCEVEFAGSSNTNNWNNLTWIIDSSASNNVNMTFQLFNYHTMQYPTSGNGYLNTALGTANVTKEQTLTVNSTDFRDVTGGWKLKFKAVNSTSAPFDIKIDLARYRTGSAIYALDLEEQWTNVTVAHQPVLCLKTGPQGAENLAVDVWNQSSLGHWEWNNLFAGLTGNDWNNKTVASSMSQPTFTIRFRSNDTGDILQNNWQIDAAFIRSESDQSLFTSLNDAVVTVELLQNGTMRWLGQNLQDTTEAIPIPPVPVKAIHVDETIRINETTYVEEPVQFQIEDWASGYTVPLGLTGNATVFSNRQMIVFLIDTHVSQFTIWWNGSDEAVQTPLAYTNTYFHDSGGALNNGRISLSVSSDNTFTVTSTVVGKSTSSTANFMRINTEASTYGAGPAYVIYNGTVRDILQQEAEWGTGSSGIGGADGCPNLYANIVLTLPANATYFTYQLRLTFLTSQQDRTITDLCPLSLSSTVGQFQTENGTLLHDPIVTSGGGTFNNVPFNPWTAHHWSQFIEGTKGAGIMFTDAANQKLFAFDSLAGSATGALKADNSTGRIELLPVATSSVHFNSALDVTWQGAVVTFDGGNPIYSSDGKGLWILAELPPTMTVNTGN